VWQNPHPTRPKPVVQRREFGARKSVWLNQVVLASSPSPPQKKINVHLNRSRIELNPNNKRLGPGGAKPFLNSHPPWPEVSLAHYIP
jgi:hypothetical protein